MSKYPVVTEDNFEEIVKKYVVRTPYKDRFGKSTCWRLKVPKPKTRQEFYELTKNMYGVGLGVTGHFDSYEVEGIQSKYDRTPVAALWNKKYGQYGLKVFLNTVFGPLSCGGVAGSHYGQFYCGHRDGLRLRKFWESEFVPSDKEAS